MRNRGVSSPMPFLLIPRSLLRGGFILRLPLELLARLDRYIDRLESHTGLKAHRGMIARRALELFLETHEAS